MDKLTPERRSENMHRIRSKGMKPELAVRRLVHRLGYRHRLHREIEEQSGKIIKLESMLNDAGIDLPQDPPF